MTEQPLARDETICIYYVYNCVLFGHKIHKAKGLTVFCIYCQVSTSCDPNREWATLANNCHYYLVTFSSASTCGWMILHSKIAVHKHHTLEKLKHFSILASNRRECSFQIEFWITSLYISYILIANLFAPNYFCE